jgi:hypothetical protein
VCVAVTGCGGGSSGDAEFTKTNAQFDRSPPSVAEARKIIHPFLYRLAAACPSTWLPSAQARCRSTAAKLKVQLAKPQFRLPKQGKLPYAAGGVQGAAVSFVVGNRQPRPGSGSLFYGKFTLRQSSGKWLIASSARP